MLILNKIKKMPQGVKASVALFLSSIITKGLAFITTPLYTRLLTANEYGQVSVYYTWMQLFGIIAMFCLSMGVFNCGMVDYPDKRDEFSFSVLALSNIITLSFTGLLLCLYPLVKEYLGIKIPYILLMCSTFFFQPAYSFWAARQRYELKYKLTAFFSIMSAIIAPSIAMICIVTTKNTDHLFSRIFGAEVPLLIMYRGFYIYLGFKVRFKVNRYYWKSVLAFNIPLIPHYLSTYLLNSSDKLMIAHYVGNEATAYYSVAYSVASMALILWTAIDSSLLPYTFENLKIGNYKNINRITLPLISIFGCGCFGVILLAPEIISILAAKSYSEAVLAIPPIVGATFFQAQYLIFSNIIYFHKKSKYVMYGSVTSVILNVLLNIFFIPKFGYLAAGYTTLIGFSCQALIDYYGMRKACKTNIYNTRVLFVLSAIIFAISIFSIELYKHALVRYLIILVFLIILILFRKKITSLFKLVRGKGDNNE